VLLAFYIRDKSNIIFAPIHVKKVATPKQGSVGQKLLCCGKLCRCVRKGGYVVLQQDFELLVLQQRKVAA